MRNALRASLHMTFLPCACRRVIFGASPDFRMNTDTLPLLDLGKHPRTAATVVAGFKDWALVCEAMGSGRQSIILRKGGLAEGRGGFQFGECREFFLFPTRFHEQAGMLRPEELRSLGTIAPDSAATVEIRYFCRLESAWRIEDWEMVARLAPFHVYREEVVRERFAYADRQHAAGALSLALCRVYRLAPAWVLADRPEFGGCKSWIELPAPSAGTAVQAVLDDATHRARQAQIEAILSA